MIDHVLAAYFSFHSAAPKHFSQITNAQIMKRALRISNSITCNILLLIQSNKVANASEMQISSSHMLVNPATTIRPIYSYKLDSMPLTPFLIQLNKIK